MKIIYRIGDVMQAREPFIVHGCNAQGRMGSGVAKLIRALYPEAYEIYEEEHRLHGLTVGQIIVAWTQPHVIINAITQEFYGKDAQETGKVYVSYEGLLEAFDTINSNFQEWNVVGHGLAMPLIGAGLAGGSWPVISQIIEEVATNFQPVVYTLDGVIPT